jgi:hypothetical protein
VNRRFRRPRLALERRRLVLEIPTVLVIADRVAGAHHYAVDRAGFGGHLQHCHFIAIERVESGILWGV